MGASPTPQSLLVMANWRSRALAPSDIHDPGFVDWAHRHGAYLYLVLVGPRIDINELVAGTQDWKIDVRFHDGNSMKPRTIRIPFDLIPKGQATLVAGAVDWTDATGRKHRSSAAQLTRYVLAKERGDAKRRALTIRKFFNYRVEYIGQSYGKAGERTAAERIGAGHKQVQQVLAEVADLYPFSAVALLAMDLKILRQELSFTLSPENPMAAAEAIGEFMTTMDGPLEPRKLVTAAEALLIRSFPEARNEQYKDFPKADAPALVAKLQDAGVSHIGIEINLTESMAMIQQLDPRDPPAEHLRFAVNLATGDPETIATSSPLAWWLR